MEALEGFFRGLPGEEPGLAFVIVTHLSPERESLLHEVIEQYTRLPVCVAADGARVEINSIHVLPADAILRIEQGHLRIDKPLTNRRQRKPIDIFFSALAADQGEFAAGVVLSGGDGDGTLGVKAIKERGGLTLAQIGDSHGPHHPDMPESAIAAGFVDLAIPVGEMGTRLVEFARSLTLLDGMAVQSRVADSESSLEDARQDIYAILRNQVGHDFGGYKTKTFLRRVQRRMQVRQAVTAEAYIELLRQEPQEVSALFRDLLINVTNFFRDAEAFDNLATLVIPRLFEGRGAEDIVRVWVPGCATGEEVFSIAILLREHMDGLSAVPRVQVFATDIDDRALAVARAGRYPDALLDSVSPARRKKYFVSDGGSYLIAKEVRDLCIFSPHSVIRDPPFSRIDLVSCRNLLIYFGLDVQNQVVPTFHYALRPEGYLFLGTSENISQFNDLFAPVDKKHRIFRKRVDGTPGLRLPLAVTRLRPGNTGELHAHRAATGGMALRQSVETQVLERFAPAFVVVNREGDIVYYSGRTGRYLEAAAGTPTRHLLAGARKGLRLDLRTMLQNAVETGETVEREDIPIEDDDGRVRLVGLTVSPVVDRNDGDDQLYLVLFHDRGPSLSLLARAGDGQDGAAVQVERELRDTRERLQSLVEEYETALEELKSSNEELVSVNEELQSTNEELEASKEELQSVNEELHTVNSDLNIKVDALDRANGDLQNLFESTDVATIFLDRNLVIRSFTPSVAGIFYMLPTDRGRPITDLASSLHLPGFTQDIAKVAAGEPPIERRVERPEIGTSYLVRIGPYRDEAGRVEGVVITFTNVTGLARSEERQRILIAELQHRTRNLLSVVQSIAAQTLGKGGSLESFGDRLAALGRVQSSISRSADENVSLGDLIRSELEAHGSEIGRKVAISGPPVALRGEQVQTFALALHELATNAVKHGALRPETLKEGRTHLDISWTVGATPDRSPTIALVWRESGVAIPPDSSRKGYGRRLIEEVLTFSLRAKTDLAFGADGIIYTIEIPLHEGTTENPGKPG